MHEITITDGYTVAASGSHEYYTTAVELTRSTAIDLRRPSGGGRAAHSRISKRRPVRMGFRADRHSTSLINGVQIGNHRRMKFNDGSGSMTC